MPDRVSELQRVFESEGASIRRYLAKLVGAGEAEDLAQEAFARAHRAVDVHRGEASLATWIRRIATHVAIDHLRRPASRLVHLAAAPGDDGCAATAADRGAEPEDAERGLIREEMRGCILGLVRSLPAPYAEVILLSEYRDLKDREVADALGISLEATKIRLHRARARLRALLEGHCELYRDPVTGLGCDRKEPGGS